MKSPKMLLAALLAATTSAFAQTPEDHAAHHPAAGASTTAEESRAMAEGEVRKVDKEAGKVTLRHGPIKNLDMPGMTMVFRVADPKMLDELKNGDKVRFSADRVNGAITVRHLEVLK